MFNCELRASELASCYVCNVMMMMMMPRRKDEETSLDVGGYAKKIVIL